MTLMDSWEEFTKQTVREMRTEFWLIFAFACFGIICIAWMVYMFFTLCGGEFL